MRIKQGDLVKIEPGYDAWFDNQSYPAMALTQLDGKIATVNDWSNRDGEREFVVQVGYVCAYVPARYIRFPANRE